jgi:hypothetical protein
MQLAQQIVVMDGLQVELHAVVGTQEGGDRGGMASSASEGSAERRNVPPMSGRRLRPASRSAWTRSSTSSGLKRPLLVAKAMLAERSAEHKVLFGTRLVAIIGTIQRARGH